VWDLSQCTPAQARHYAGMAASKFASLAESAVLPVSVVPTPEEEDFFAALNVPCWPPEQRTERRLVQFVKQAKWPPAAVYQKRERNTFAALNTGKLRLTGVCIGTSLTTRSLLA